MADVHDKKTRSYNMSRIKGKDTKPEMLVRRFLHANGFRYRLHVKDMPGKPDIVLPKYKTMIFVHGCFWHQHPGCKRAQTPKTQPEFWEHKFRNNLARDRRNVTALEQRGWKVSVIWECETKTQQGLFAALRRSLAV